jgi:mannose-6-phosphate isomerase-like protein (cupin superfamily)
VAVGAVLGALLFSWELQASDPRNGRLIVVPPNEGLDLYPGKWKITKRGTSGGFSLVEVNDRATRKIDPHRHTREDEAWYVIEGELSFQVGDEGAVAGPGALVYAPRGVPHSFKVTKVPARYLIMFSPAGIEALFAEVAELRKTLGEGTAEFERRRNEVRAKHGLQSIEKKDTQKPRDGGAVQQ